MASVENECCVRGLHFQLSDSQRRRLRKAQEVLHEAPGSYHASSFVNIADSIHVQNESTVLKGHGTQLVDGQLMATLCGVVERVDQLITVKPFRARYNAETGDVVVGRITEVGAKRWKVDINFRQDVHLMLSSVNLPGGIQAEVQSVHNDGSVHLHTRSLKYGKLENGQLVKVAAYLVKRLKQHFHSLKQYGVDMIVGCNGYIWIAAASEEKTVDVQNTSSINKELNDNSATAESSVVVIPLPVRQRICRLANSIRVLSALGFLIYPDVIIDTYEVSISKDIALKDMLGPEFSVLIAEREAARRSKKSALH